MEDFRKKYFPENYLSKQCQIILTRSKKCSRIGYWHLQRLRNRVQPHTLQKGKLRPIGRK